MDLRKFTLKELPLLVNLHYSVLPGEFLTSISKSFLLGFYQNLFSSPNTHFLGMFDKENLIGAIVGLEENYKPKLNSYLLLFIKNLPAFLTSPKSLPRAKSRGLISLFQSFLFKIGQPQETEIFFIGVKKQFRGQRIGKKLIDSIEQSLPLEYKTLSVDCKCKLPSNKFYEACGFKMKKTFMLYNEKWNRYAKSIK